MVRTQVIYLDTHIVVGFHEGRRSVITAQAQRALEQESDVRISPLVLLELEYLNETRRIKPSANRMAHDLADEIGLRVCDAPFHLVAQTALTERWTRDPFDRIIVAQARLHRAALITLDRTILEHYSRALA
jgi:PIN domain nuclease of toxin-antitoxin system